MNIRILVISFLVLINSCANNKNREFDRQFLFYAQDNADEYFEKNLEYLRGKIENPVTNTKQKIIIYQLEKLTGIKSKHTCQEYTCKITNEDIEKWQNWYLQHKNKIYFDLLEQKVCFRDSINCKY
jgi:hypothetical protein